ncbi:uncharacterized protein [Euphorbia lathyris]|uniref:uncharacterized protein n=1 Tax=Euphorbia lathyris TaxID=212925 RepID=UPI00331424B2
MTVVKDEWVRAAMTDDRVVVELLLRLKQAQASLKPQPQPVIPLRWGLRLPRSKPCTSVSLRCDRKENDFPARFSPTTPLSWSGGGGGGSSSPSATADGFEETSRRVSRSPPGVRSKGTANAESASTATTTKRSRRKKTFAELKEEEGLLMKESIHLRKEIANLNATFKEQTARNDNLKRIKVDLNLQCVKLSSIASEEPKAIYSQHDGRDIGSCDTRETVSNHDRSFLLPDLNSMPLEEDPASEALSGTR